MEYLTKVGIVELRGFLRIRFDGRYDSSRKQVVFVYIDHSQICKCEDGKDRC